MNRKLGTLGTTLLIAGLLVPFSAKGHDPSKHKGKAIQGEVVSVAKDRIEVRTAGGVKPVLLTEKTKFERGDQAASLADLKKGDSISIIGTTLASGELAAREVLLKPAGTHRGHGDKTGRKP